MSEPEQLRTNPYVGPRAFRPDERLYGREREARELVNLLLAERIVVLLSPSGAGKTSLIHAALLPRLQARRFYVLPTIRVNLDPGDAANYPAGERPFNRYVFSALRSLDDALPPEQQLDERRLAQMSLAEYLDQRPHPGPQAGENRVADLLIFDQFEEILTFEPSDREGKIEFFNQLGAALGDNRRWALFAMREDYIAALDPYVIYVPTRFATTFRLDFLTGESASQAIRQPACEQGVDFLEEAALKLVDDLRRVKVQRPDGSVEDQPGLYVEPMQLQVVCYRLWESLDPDLKEVEAAHVESVGDVDTALAGYYAQRVVSIAQETGAKEKAIREWIDRQLITEQGIRGQVLRGARESAGLDNRIVSALENAHLVRAEKRRGATWYELAHDRLIRPVRANNNTWFQANLTLLQRQASMWENQGRPESLLLSDQGLAEAIPWAEQHAADITLTERDFLRASQNAFQRAEQSRLHAEQALKLEAAHKVAEAEKRRAEEQAGANQKLRQRAFYLVGLLGLALALSVWAFLAQMNANENALVAVQKAETATAALGMSYISGTQAAGNAATAQVLKGQAETNLQAAKDAQGTAIANLNAYQAAATEAAFQATQAAQKEVVLQEQASLAAASQLTSLASSLSDVQLDLSLLLALEANTITQTTETRAGLLTALQSNPNLIRYLGGHTAAVRSLAFNPQGTLLASAGADGAVRLWNVSTGEPEGEPLEAMNGEINSVAFSANGRRLAAGGCGERERGDICLSGEIRVWDLTTRILTTLSGHQNTVTVVAFSRDGNTLLSAGADRSVRLWDLRKLAPTGSAVSGHSDAITAALFMLDGQTVATASLDGTVGLWRISDGASVIRLDAKSGPVLSLAQGSDGRTLVSGHADGALHIWNIFLGRNGDVSVNTGQAPVVALAFQPGRTDRLAVATGDGQLRIYDPTQVGKPGLLNPLVLAARGHTDQITSLAFSADGATLATGSRDKNIILWRTTPRLGLEEARYDVRTPVRDVAFNEGDTLKIIGPTTVFEIEAASGELKAGASSTFNQEVGDPFFTPSGEAVYLRLRQSSSWVQGVSVHARLGEIDWPAVRGSRIEYAYIKASEGREADPNFEANWEGAAAAGLLRGAYHIYLPGERPQQQAAFFLKAIQRQTGDLPPAVYFVPQVDIDPVEVSAQLEVFLSLVKDASGYTPVIMTQDSAWDAGLGALEGGPDWSQYPLGALQEGQTGILSLPKSWSNWAFWHYDWGEVKGIPSTVSLIRFNGTRAALRDMAGSPSGSSSQPAQQGVTFGVELVLLQTGELLGSAEKVSVLPSSAAVDPSETILALGGKNGSLALWSLASGEQMGGLLVVSEGEVSKIAFSPDGRFIAAGSVDGALRLWDRDSLPYAGEVLVAHTGPVLSLAFSPDGALLASGGQQGSLVLWNLATRQSLGRLLNNYPEPVRSLAFSPDSRRLVSATGEMSLWVWQTSYADWQAAANAIANRSLTESERTQFMGTSAGP